MTPEKSAPGRKRIRARVAILVGVVILAVAIALLLPPRITVVTLAMNWSANGVAPWGDVERDDSDEAPVLVYRKVVEDIATTQYFHAN